MLEHNYDRVLKLLDPIRDEIDRLAASEQDDEDVYDALMATLAHLLVAAERNVPSGTVDDLVASVSEDVRAAIQEHPHCPVHWRAE